MRIVYQFNKLWENGRLEDLNYPEEINEDENWFKSREDAFAWLKKLDPEIFDGVTLVLTEMIFP
jgi:hypothetical protein